jgi:LPXTG-motif cell wall-anchored protein
MKLRHAIAVAVATAAIAPAALLAAPAAFASDGLAPRQSAPAGDEGSSPTASTSVTSSTSGTSAKSALPKDDSTGDTSTGYAPAKGTSGDEASANDTSAKDKTPGKKPSTPSGKDTSGSTSTPPTGPSPGDEMPKECDKSQLDLTIKGLPGEIAAGSGWHTFTLNVSNSSDAVAKGITFFAGASSDKNGDNLFASKKVALQALNPQTNVWDDISEGGKAVGYVGETEQLKPDYELDIALRINVKPTAPVGAGFTLGAGVYLGADDCVGADDVAYKFRIVAAGTDTSGTKPQEGGRTPVPTKKPDASTTVPVEGSLAETGSSSMTRTIGIAGGAAIVLGGGALFVVRRRKAGTVA